MTVPTTLYRFFDASDRLLYIGITVRGPIRWVEHQRTKEWWPLVARSSAEHFETQAEAVTAEQAAILAEKPIHNVVHTRTRRIPREATRRGNGQGSIYFVAPRSRWAVSAPGMTGRTAYYFRDEGAARAFLEILIRAHDPEVRRAIERLIA